jgi:hypothetical protein
MNRIGIILLASILISASGCKPNHRIVIEKFNVSYVDPIDNKTSCEFRIYGSEQYAGKDKGSAMDLSYLKSPYTVFIIFNLPKEQSGTVELKEISFSSNGSLVKRLQVNSKRMLSNIIKVRRFGVWKKEEKDVSSASFSIEQVGIPHSQLTVLVTAVISTEHGDILKTWKLELTPITEEELRNTLSDNMMSV